LKHWFFSQATTNQRRLRVIRRFWQFRLFLLIIPAAGALRLHAQGGPPFITDDPGTPGNKHWEINLGWIADHSPVWPTTTSRTST
jgi:hypothetical protein